MVHFSNFPLKVVFQNLGDHFGRSKTHLNERMIYLERSVVSAVCARVPWLLTH